MTANKTVNHVNNPEYRSEANPEYCLGANPEYRSDANPEYCSDATSVTSSQPLIIACDSIKESLEPRISSAANEMDARKELLNRKVPPLLVDSEPNAQNIGVSGSAFDSQTCINVSANVSVPFKQHDQYSRVKESQLHEEKTSIGADHVNSIKEHANNNGVQVSSSSSSNQMFSEQEASCLLRPTSLFPLQPTVSLSQPAVSGSQPTVSASQLTVSSTCPPEFSISPADSLSKASSSENIESSIHYGVEPAPHSPTSLSVKLNGGTCMSSSILAQPANVATLALSPTYNSLHGSLASSINDLTIEAEQLERSIKSNDTRFVRRMLELHHCKVPINLHASIFDKTSHGSRHSHCGVIQDADLMHLKSRATLDRFLSTERRESGSTEEPGGESPSIFTNALHLAIESNVYDICVLLLKYGIDPNEAGVIPYNMDPWRRSSHTSEESSAPLHTNNDRLTINNLNLINSTSREPLIRTPSMRSTNSPNLLSPLAGPSNHTSGTGPAHNIYFALNSSPSSINSDISSVGKSSTPTKLIHMRQDLAPNLRVVYINEEGNSVTYEEEYTRENLYSLPPIFLAVVIKNSSILRELIQYGANVNVSDRFGVTPLHLSLCQEHISRSCVHLLIQNGAKVKCKNNQGTAPYHLYHGSRDEFIQLQKAIVENAFAQIVPQQSTSSKQTSSNNSNNNHMSSLSAFPHLAAEDISGSGSSAILCPASNHFNNNISANVKSSATASAIIKRFQLSSKAKENNKKDVYICLDHAERISPDGPTNNSYHDSIQSEIGGSAGCRRSIAGDSNPPSIIAHEDDVSLVSFAS